MDRRVTLQTIATTPGAQGFPVSAATTLATVWAHKKETSGTESEANGLTRAQGTVLFTIRHRADVGPAERLTCESIGYNILHTREIGRRQYLEITTERRTDG